MGIIWGGPKIGVPRVPLNIYLNGSFSIVNQPFGGTGYTHLWKPAHVSGVTAKPQVPAWTCPSAAWQRVEDGPGGPIRARMKSADP